MSRTTTTKPSAISAEMVIRALQDATPTAYATRDDMHRDTWTTEHQARALVYLCSETADATPQEYWEEQQFNADGIREQRHWGILPGDHDIRARMQATRHAVQLATDAAAAELRAHCPDRFIRIRTGERSTMKILNTRERISEMVATVRRSPGLFGGGKVDKVAPARKATTWKARSVAMVWEMLQDGDAAGALDLADTMGAMFYSFGSYGNWCGMTWAPLPVDGMPAGFVSARRCDGQWTVFHAGSMLAMNEIGKPTSRAKAEQVARELWNSKTEDQQAHALQAAANSPQDQAEARAAWIKLHSITTEAETTQHDETTGPTEMVNIISELTGAVMETVPREKAEELAAMIGTTVQAARQVSELIANATTAAVIEQASEAAPIATPDECEAGSELATVDACSESEATATSCDASSAGNAPSAPQIDGEQKAEDTAAPQNAAEKRFNVPTPPTWDYRLKQRGGSTYLIPPVGQAFTPETRRALRDWARDAGYSASIITDNEISVAAVTDGPSLDYIVDGVKEQAYGRQADKERAAAPAPSIPEGYKPAGEPFYRRTVYRWYGDERDQAPAVSTPAPAVDTAQAPAAPTFQTIIGKSGNWCARFRRLPDGAPVLEFSTRPNDWSIYVYKTGRERMAALQAMARQADQGAQPDAQTDRERRFDAMTATAADVQAMDPEYLAEFLEDLTDCNMHTECLIVRALAAGREDLAARARSNLREHLRAGYLTDAMRIDRQAISEALRQSTEPEPTNPAGDTPSSAPTNAPGYTPPAPDHHQQTAPVPNLADKVPRAVGADSGPASNPPGATAPSAPAPSAPAPSAPAPDTEASADEPEPEFTRTRPQPFDMLAMIAAGLAPDDFVGLGIVYSGDRANASGRGAITDVQPCSWYKYTITVTLEDGRQSRLNPVSFTEHLGNRYKTDFKRHGAPYLAELAAARLAVEAADKAAKQAAADDKARQLRELPQQWPQLKAYDPAGKLNGPTLAAHNIRVLLKEQFPKVKFSVKSDRFSGGDAIDIRWTDGPNTKAVEKIADQFEAGSFNGQEDIYEYAHSVFRDLFGDAKYIHCHRDISDALLSQAIAAEYPGTESRPTVEDYRKAQGVFSHQHRDEWHARRIRERLETMGAGLPS